MIPVFKALNASIVGRPGATRYLLLLHGLVEFKELTRRLLPSQERCVACHSDRGVHLLHCASAIHSGAQRIRSLAPRVLGHDGA